MKYASEDLVHEHEGILRGLKILEEMAGSIKKKRSVEVNDLRDILDFFKTFADKCHHGKEESLLFPAMEKYGIPNVNGPIGQMLYEHEKGRKCLREMTEDVNADNLDSFAENAAEYIRLLRDHIVKENAVLFPLGDEKIPIEIESEIIEKFEDYERTVMGVSVHEGFHKMLNDLESKYLK